MLTVSNTVQANTCIDLFDKNYSTVAFQNNNLSAHELHLLQRLGLRATQIENSAQYEITPNSHILLGLFRASALARNLAALQLELKVPLILDTAPTQAPDILITPRINSREQVTHAVINRGWLSRNQSDLIIALDAFKLAVLRYNKIIDAGIFPEQLNFNSLEFSFRVGHIHGSNIDPFLNWMSNRMRRHNIVFYFANNQSLSILRGNAGLAMGREIAIQIDAINHRRGEPLLKGRYQGTLAHEIVHATMASRFEDRKRGAHRLIAFAARDFSMIDIPAYSRRFRSDEVEAWHIGTLFNPLYHQRRFDFQVARDLAIIQIEILATAIHNIKQEQYRLYFHDNQLVLPTYIRNRGIVDLYIPYADNHRSVNMEPYLLRQLEQRETELRNFLAIQMPTIVND